MVAFHGSVCVPTSLCVIWGAPNVQEPVAVQMGTQTLWSQHEVGEQTWPHGQSSLIRQRGDMSQ